MADALQIELPKGEFSDIPEDLQESLEDIMDEVEYYSVSLLSASEDLSTERDQLNEEVHDTPDIDPQPTTIRALVKFLLTEEELTNLGLDANKSASFLVVTKEFLDTGIQPKETDYLMYPRLYPGVKFEIKAIRPAGQLGDAWAIIKIYGSRSYD